MILNRNRLWLPRDPAADWRKQTDEPGLFTCVACRANPTQRRALSRSVPRHAAPSEPSPSGIARLTSRKLLSVSGPHAAKYLQGVITANLYPGSAQPAPDHLRTDAGFYAAFLTAQGRVLHDVFLVEVDAAEAERLHKHIRRYKLRAKFDVRVLDPSEAAVWHLWSDDDPQSALLDAKPETLTITAPDPRAPGLGHRLVTFDNPSPLSTTTSPLTAATATPLPLPVLDESAYRLRRYLQGIAEGQAELLYGQALPHESNMDLTGAVDFRKGCYVGQELTICTEHRGVVRKRILPWAGGKGLAGLYKPEIGAEGGVDAEMVPAKASIGRVGKKGRSAGKWLSGVGNVGLALCRLEIMTDVVLPGETGGLGFSGGDKFAVGLEGGWGWAGQGQGFCAGVVEEGVGG
ncbi:hypothetical protein VTK56DRAFT_6546 [Thermocarpiscus australiensis]